MIPCQNCGHDIETVHYEVEYTRDHLFGHIVCMECDCNDGE
jgi:hypothetical protein